MNSDPILNLDDLFIELFNPDAQIVCNFLEEDAGQHYHISSRCKEEQELWKSASSIHLCGNIFVFCYIFHYLTVMNLWMLLFSVSYSCDKFKASAICYRKQLFLPLSLLMVITPCRNVVLHVTRSGKSTWMNLTLTSQKRKRRTVMGPLLNR